MKPAPLPKNENDRLSSLKELEILDTAIEESYDEITKLASEICETPIALVSLLDETRQWFKSHHGLDAESTPRELAFCGHAILEEDIFEIQDSREDDRFHDNPLVTGAPNVIFYAGTQLKTPDNLNLGTLCVIDNQPRELNDFQKRALKTLGNQVSSLFELRRNLNRLSKAKAKEAALALAVTYSHEINNPLTIVAGNLRKVKGCVDDEVYTKLKEATKRIGDVVKQITDTITEKGIELEEYCEGSVKMKVHKDD